VSSSPDSGTELTVELPVGRAYFTDEEIVQEQQPEQQPVLSAAIESQLPQVIDKAAQVEADGTFTPVDNASISEADGTLKTADGTAVPEALKTADGTPIPETEGTLILVVEDHADVRKYIHRSLESEATVVEAGDGEDGLRKAAELVPDLVISDVMMPRMDGHALCEQLKRDEKTSHIPVILLTARAGEESKLAGLATGADDYLIKPFNPRELRLRVHNLIEQRRHLQDHYRREAMLQPRRIAATSMNEMFLNRLMDIVEVHLGDEGFGVEMLSQKMGMTARQMHRKMRALTDQSPVEFLRNVRLQRAHQLLEQQAGTVSEIVYQVGFSNLSYFSKVFREKFGVLPSEVASESTR
jgi:DNA-binding response OmpR family regulator